MQPATGFYSGSSTHAPSMFPRSRSPTGNLRNRVKYTCHSCSRRKIKCDKVHPVCGTCAKNGTECIYDGELRKDEAAYRGSRGLQWQDGNPTSELTPADMRSGQMGVPTDEGPGIVSQMDKVISTIERLDEERNQVAAVAMDNKSTKIAPINDSKKAASSRPVSPLPRSTASVPASSEEVAGLADSMENLDLGHLILEDDGRSRYVGTTSWAFLSHEIKELNQMLRTRSTDTVPKVQKTDKADKGAAVSPGFPEFLQYTVVDPTDDDSLPSKNAVHVDMLDHIPTRRQSQILYKGFMSGVHPLSPIIHPPIISKLYNAFWDWYDYGSFSGVPCPDPSFIPLLYAIWYGGSVTVSVPTIKAEFNAPSRFALATIYSQQVTDWLTKVSFPHKPSLQSLAAYLISQTILSKEEEPLSSCLFVSLAVSVGQTMGLHRDPAQFNIGAWEAEYRRRLWWHIVHMDCVIALSSGLPPLVSDESYWDVRETSEIKDTMLGTKEAIQYEALVAAGLRGPDSPDNPAFCDRSSMVNIYYFSAKGKCIMAQAVRQILKIQLGTKPLTKGDTEKLRSVLLDLQSRLNSIIDRIPEPEEQDTQKLAHFTANELPGEDQFDCPEQYHSPVLIAFHKWTRIILSLFIDKAFCITYQPFLKNPRSRIWPVARQTALRHCYAFMEKFIRMATDPDFEPFQWGWPGNHQPMHATMIMLVDIYKQPNSPEAPKSRAYIDHILALSGPDGGVVGGDGASRQRPLRDGGREAWDVIRRLREKAWRQAGLDPQMFWTEQDHMQAGLGPEFKSAENDVPLGYVDQNNPPIFGLSPVSVPVPVPEYVPGVSSTLTPPSVMPLAACTGTDSASDLASVPVVPMSGAQQIHPSPSAITSMPNTNYNFDWDEWDAVFGPLLPVADELMEVDAASQFQFADSGNMYVPEQ